MTNIIEFNKEKEERENDGYTNKIGEVGIIANEEVACVELIDTGLSIDYVEPGVLAICVNDELMFSFYEEALLPFLHIALRFFDSENKYDIDEGIEMEYLEDE